MPLVIQNKVSKKYITAKGMTAKIKVKPKEIYENKISLVLEYSRNPDSVCAWLFLQVQQDEISNLRANQTIIKETHPGSKVNIDLNPGEPDSAKIIVWQYLGTLGAGESVVDTLQF